MPGACLTVEHLWAGYGDQPVLHDVSLTVAPGRVVVLMGPNGAGKTTLLRAIFNLVPHVSGHVRLGEAAITGMLANRLLAQGVAYVPQGKVNFRTLTVEENLRLGAFTLAPTALEAALHASLTVFPVLARRLKSVADTLSGGQQQMLALARALMQRPRLLLLDEPSLGLSPKLVQHAFATIQRINELFGTTCVIVEHNLRSALKIADEGYIMVQGRIIAHDTSTNIVQSPMLKKVFLGEFE